MIGNRVPSRGVLDLVRRLRGDTAAAALLEFAFALPILLTMSLTGAELCNYIITRMRVSQLALHIADNASRIGSGGQLQIKTISEADIRDLFEGVQYQSGELGLKANGRVILSSLEPMADPNPSPKKFKIRWQRCYGSQTYTPKYGVAGNINLAGMGKPNRLVTTPDKSQTMFVELFFKYKPLVDVDLVPQINIVEQASMLVRDMRETTGTASGVYPSPGTTPATC